jgi:hypothetical protein
LPIGLLKFLDHAHSTSDGVKKMSEYQVIEAMLVEAPGPMKRLMRTISSRPQAKILIDGQKIGIFPSGSGQSGFKCHRVVSEKLPKKPDRGGVFQWCSGKTLALGRMPRRIGFLASCAEKLE